MTDFGRICLLRPPKAKTLISSVAYFSLNVKIPKAKNLSLVNLLHHTRFDSFSHLLCLFYEVVGGVCFNC